MSYAMNGFGFFIPPLAHAPKPCEGQEKAGRDCCPPDTWSNETYLNIKGPPSWYYQVEKRIRTAEALLVAPVSGFASGIELFAYDSGGLSVQPGLVARAQAAFALFEQAFPAARWSLNEQGIPSDCQVDGYYAVYVEDPSWPDARIAAIDRAGGTALTAADVAMLRSGRIPQAWHAWVGQQGAVYHATPGSALDVPVRAMPDLSDLLLVQSGVVMPSPWLESFLVTFTPRPRRLRPGIAPVRMPPPRITVRPGAPITIPGGLPGLAPKGGEAAPFEVSTGVLVAGALVLAGGAYLAVRALR